MICPKCTAEIPDGSTVCPECHTKFEIHVSSFAGSVHWEDKVKPFKNEREKRRTFIICGIILVLACAAWLLYHTGLLGVIISEIQWFFLRLRYPAS